MSSVSNFKVWFIENGEEKTASFGSAKPAYDFLEREVLGKPNRKATSIDGALEEIYFENEEQVRIALQRFKIWFNLRKTRKPIARLDSDRQLSIFGD